MNGERKGDDMASWSVIVWAVVTPDLEDALRADLVEAEMALGQLPQDCDLHVHVNIVRVSDDSTTIWPQSDDGTLNPSWPRGPDHPHDVLTHADLDELLTGAGCWNDDGRHRFLVLWGHGVRAFPSPGRDAGVPSADEVVDALDGRPLPDIVGYDACWMATIHTVSTLAATVPEGVFIGSMVPEPISGWPYAELIRILCGPGSPKAVAAAVVQAYAASLSVPDWCMVALDLKPVSAGEPGLTEALQTLMSTDPPERVPFFAAADGADILEDTNLADLGALMRRLQVGRVNQEAAAVEAALRRSTVARRAAGSLSGRDGVAVRLGVPGDSPPEPPWPTRPSWTDYLPEV